MNAGFMYAVLAYLVWGLLPLYWNLFHSASAWEILAHRVVWSFAFVALLCIIGRRWKEALAALADRKKLAVIGAGSLLISTNWVLFIWAVNNGHVIDTSLGYYINPLINVALGIAFLKERPGIGQWLAIGIALIGVVVMAAQLGSVPWISLALAASFGLYGLTKKAFSLDPMIALIGETAVVLPLALLYLLFIHSTGTATAGSLPAPRLLALLLAGVATATPLFWFAQAAKRLSLSTVGFIQYIGPTLTLLLGIVFFKESFTGAHMISFSLIWLALIIYTWTSLRKGKRTLPAANTAIGERA